MIKINNILTSLVILIILSGCQKWIDPEINDNPNSPTDVPMGSILPALEASTAYKVAGGTDMLRIPAIWMQQFDGVAGEAMATANYIQQPASLSFIWDECYAEILMDARILMDKSEEEKSPHNRGVANVLTAFILGQMTDVWNDIPWQEALQGQANFQPMFDSQESIYEEIHRLLNEAITDLQNPDEPIGVKGDYIYEGDAEKWLKAAHAMKARYMLHLSKKYGEQAYLDALEDVALSFSDNAEDMQFIYGTGTVESNPLYQYMLIVGDVSMGAFFIDLLISYQDPRITVYALPDENGGYTGSQPGSGNMNASPPGLAVAAADALSYFITYVELLFIKSEAQFMTGQDENSVKETLLLAVSKSLEKNEVMDTTWFSGYTDHVNSLKGDELYKEIMTQKYIATFYQPEAFHSWRRTGMPELTPNPNGATTEIPRRFPYPMSEQLYNPNTPTGIEITDRVWWDQ
jgi:hypothetical protein